MATRERSQAQPQPPRQGAKSPAGAAIVEPTAQDSQTVDWARIEALYRSGKDTIASIAAEAGISRQAIIKKARVRGWTRDLEAAIQARAKSLVTQRVTSAVTPATEEATVEANAQVVAHVLLTERKDIARLRSIAIRMIDEIEQQSADPGLFAELGELVAKAAIPDDSLGLDPKVNAERQRKMREAFDKAMTTGARTKTVKDLADILKTLIALEREAYNIQPVVANPANAALGPEPDPAKQAEHYRWFSQQQASKNQGAVH